MDSHTFQTQPPHMVSGDHFPQPNMDQKPKPPKQKINHMMSNFCLPRFRTTTNTTTCGRTTRNHHRWSPAISLLDRIREALFRLIMLSALSSSTNKTTQKTDGGVVSGDHRRGQRSRSYNPSDSHYTEAVADCIEFIKKSSATNTDGSRDSSASSSRSSAVDAAAAEVVFPVSGAGYVMY